MVCHNVIGGNCRAKKKKHYTIKKMKSAGTNKYNKIKNNYDSNVKKIDSDPSAAFG